MPFEFSIFTSFLFFVKCLIGEEMLKVAIVDDSLEDLNLLKEHLISYCKEKDIKMDVDCYNRGLTFLDNIKNKYDVVFFDIDMPVLNGLDTAKRLRLIDERISIIFTTNLASMAINGYEVNALDFLVKPIPYSQFCIALDKALSNLQKGFSKRLLIKIKQGLKAIPYDELKFVEVRKHDLIFYTSDSEYQTRGTLKDLEAILPKERFCKCNSCYLVNLSYVTKVLDDRVYFGSDYLTMSRGKKKTFVEAFINYVG